MSRPKGAGRRVLAAEGTTQKRDKKRDRNFLPAWLRLVLFSFFFLVLRCFFGFCWGLRLRFVSLFAATATNFNKLQLHLPKSASRCVASHRMASGSSSGRSASLMATPSALAAAHTALFLHHPLFYCVPYAAARRLHNSICVKVLWVRGTRVLLQLLLLRGVVANGTRNATHNSNRIPVGAAAGLPLRGPQGSSDARSDCDSCRWLWHYMRCRNLIVYLQARRHVWYS